MTEVIAGKVGDFAEGKPVKVDVGEQSVLVVREEGNLHAIANKCSHYGAPLTNGAYCKGTVRCPWHGACFNVKTGDIEDFPGLDGIQTFKVEVKGEDVVVKVDPVLLENFRAKKPMVKKAADNNNTTVLIGGGPATLVCAETLRQSGYTGRVVLVSQEEHLPYDRIKLSKAMAMTTDAIALRPNDFYTFADIELKLGQQVTAVSVKDKKVSLANGESLKYDSLVVATGGTPRRLPTPGQDLAGVFSLRTPADANAIAAQAQGKNVVIVGSSFIGMEVAAFLADKAQSVSVVDLVKVPFQLTLGQEIGAFMQKMHESKGVKFHFETSVKEFKGSNGKLTEAVLANGSVLPADVAVMGVGVVPATDFLKSSGLPMTDRGFVTVNKKMEASGADGVYVCGDIVEFPLAAAGGKQANVQHWQMAHKHGRIAGLNIAGKSTEINSVPYFWTVQYGKSVRYAGYGPGYDDIVVHGNMDDGKFLAYYTKGAAVVAAASLGWDPVVSQFAELLSRGGSVTKDEISKDASPWTSRL